MSWWGRYFAWMRLLVPNKKPPPPMPVSPWDGIGAFTSWDAKPALELVGLVDWVCYRPDLAKPDDVTRLQAAFPGRCYPWLDDGAKLTEATSSPVIVQSEGPYQQANAQACERYAASARALVGEPDYLLAGWQGMIECYGDDPPHQVKVLDYGDAIPVLGIGTYGPLADYLPLPAKYQRHFALYTVEQLSDADRALLAQIRA